MRTIFLATALSIIFFSCEKTINIEIPDDGRKLTVNCLFSADDGLMLNLTASRYILDGAWEFDTISGADVSLFEDGKFVEKLTGEQGYYYSNTLPVTGKNYRIEVAANGFPDIKAENTIPEPSEIKDISISQSVDEYGNPAVKFNIQFQDNPAAENYYYMEIYKRIIYSYIDEETDEKITTASITPEFLSSADPNTFERDWGIGSGIYLDGSLINGRLYTLELISSSSLNIYDEQGEDFEDKNGTTYFVNLHSISKVYFLYFKSLMKQEEATDDFFMEPVQVFSNIENGFGVFAGMSTDIDSIKIEPLM